MPPTDIKPVEDYKKYCITDENIFNTTIWKTNVIPNRKKEWWKVRKFQCRLSYVSIWFVKKDVEVKWKCTSL